MGLRIRRFLASRTSWRRGSFPTVRRCGILIFRRCLTSRSRRGHEPFCFVRDYKDRAAVSHISRKMSEMRGTQNFVTGKVLNKAMVGLRPSFSAHVRPTASRGRFGERGAPVQFLNSVGCAETHVEPRHLYDGAGGAEDFSVGLDGYGWLIDAIRDWSADNALYIAVCGRCIGGGFAVARAGCAKEGLERG